MWYKSKTFWFNVLAAIVVIAANFGYTGELPANWLAVIGPGLALLNAIIDIVKRK